MEYDKSFIQFSSEVKTEHEYWRDELTVLILPTQYNDGIYQQPINVAPLINDSDRIEINIVNLN